MGILSAKFCIFEQKMSVKKIFLDSPKFRVLAAVPSAPTASTPLSIVR